MVISRSVHAVVLEKFDPIARPVRDKLLLCAGNSSCPQVCCFRFVVQVFVILFERLQCSRSEPLSNRFLFRYASAPFRMSPLPERECAVHSQLDVTTSAASSSRPSSPSSPGSFLERHVGQLVAGVASAIALGLAERARGGALTSGTKWQAGELLAELFKLKRCMGGAWDFDKVAKERGTIALREACSKLSPETVDKLIAGALDILTDIVKSQSN
jgi:hypothetical protein